MKVVGSVIARLGSKRLTFKNILPYKGQPLALRAISKLLACDFIDRVVLSTDSELIARTCFCEKVEILRRPTNLSGDSVPSVPVFKHIVENFPCDVHLNYNCNFPECEKTVFQQAIELAFESGEALSVPYAAWAQTKERLENYGDPMHITATRFESKDIHPVDIHTMEDLLSVHRDQQSDFYWKSEKENSG